MQNLLHFDAPDQNPLDLIGFPVVGSCGTPLFCIRKGRHSSRRAHTKVSHRKYFGRVSPASTKIIGFDSLKCKIFRIAPLATVGLSMHDPSFDRPSLPSRPTGLRLSNGGGKMG
jgi:hypothetical protein